MAASLGVQYVFDAYLVFWMPQRAFDPSSDRVHYFAVVIHFYSHTGGSLLGLEKVKYIHRLNHAIVKPSPQDFVSMQHQTSLPHDSQGAQE
jgi:hypothetical protein